MSFANLYCEHQKLRTVCAACKPAPAPEPAPAVVQLPSGRTAAALPSEAPNEDASPMAARGPGKPLMPLRRSKRKATRVEAENAEAWWVKK